MSSASDWDTFSANGITEEDKKGAVFLFVVGPATYKLLRNLLSPAKPGEMSYEELVRILTARKPYSGSSSTADSGSRENQSL